MLYEGVPKLSYTIIGQFLLKINAFSCSMKRVCLLGCVGPDAFSCSMRRVCLLGCVGPDAFSCSIRRMCLLGRVGLDAFSCSMRRVCLSDTKMMRDRSKE